MAAPRLLLPRGAEMAAEAVGYLKYELRLEGKALCRVVVTKPRVMAHAPGDYLAKAKPPPPPTRKCANAHTFLPCLSPQPIHSHLHHRPAPSTCHPSAVRQPPPPPLPSLSLFVFGGEGGSVDRHPVSAGGSEQPAALTRRGNCVAFIVGKRECRMCRQMCGFLAPLAMKPIRYKAAEHSKGSGRGFGQRVSSSCRGAVPSLAGGRLS